MKLLAALLIALPLAAQTKVRVTETAGLARVNEPIAVTVAGHPRVFFVSIGPRQTKTFKLSSLAPRESLDVKTVGNAGFHASNSSFSADATPRAVNGAEEDSGMIRGLTFKPAGVTILRTQNRMHWAPSFQRTGARGYTSMAVWSPVQTVKRDWQPGYFATSREGSHPAYPEIKLWSEYRFFAHVPYFLFEAKLDFIAPIDMFWLRGQEMTMDKLFTHMVAPDATTGEPKLLTIDQTPPLPADAWIAFVNLDKGYGFGAVPLGWSATTTANPHLAIDNGANDGKYWDRHVVSRVSTPLKPGDRYTEKTAFVLFRPRPGAPAAEFLEWRARLLNPLRAEPVR